MNESLKPTLIIAGKVIALTLVLMVASGIGSKMLPVTAPSEEASGAAAAGAAAAPAPSFLGLVLAVMFAQVVALSLPIVRSRWHGWRLTATIFLVHFGTVTFLNQIESLVYLDDKLPDGFVSGLLSMGLFTAAVFAPIAVVTLGRWRPAPSPAGETARPGTGLGRWAWRVPAAGVVYVALYYLFGYYVAWQSPELRAYYGGTDPGSFLAQMSGIVRTTPWMLPLQFVRGLGWVALGLLVIRAMKGAWWQGGLATALLFAVPCLYLLLPNPMMPEVVTRLHLVETLPYQFLFGGFLAWFFRARPSPVAHAASGPGTLW